MYGERKLGHQHIGQGGNLTAEMRFLRKTAGHTLRATLKMRKNFNLTGKRAVCKKNWREHL
jgi:hypothetical protein